jgi:hypothetical protein
LITIAKFSKMRILLIDIGAIILSIWDYCPIVFGHPRLPKLSSEEDSVVAQLAGM